MKTNRDSEEWCKGFDIGQRQARNGLRPQDCDDPSNPRHRGNVAGWRLHNGLRATPLPDDYDDGTWGAPPEPATCVQ